MNQSPVIENPWKSADKLPLPHAAWLLLSALTLLCALLTPAFWGVALYSYVALAVCFAYTVLMGRALRATLPILVGCFLLSTFVGLAFGALFAAFAVGVAAGGYLATALKKWAPLALLLPAAAFGIALLVTRSVELALLTLLPLPAILALALATRLGACRTAAICATVGGWLVSLGALLAFLVWRYTGTLTLDALRLSVEALRGGTVDTLLALRAELLRITEEQLALQPAEAQQTYQSMLEQIRSTLSDEQIHALVAGLFNLSPALAILLSAALAFPAQDLLNRTYFRTGLKEVLTPRSVHLTASFSAALFFLLASVLQLLLPDGLGRITAENMSLILLPLFFLIGVRDFVNGTTALNGRKGRRGFWIFFLLAAVCCSLSLVINVIALFAASGRLTAQFRRLPPPPNEPPSDEEEPSDGEEPPSEDG